jgi:hypothetical protein
LSVILHVIAITMPIPLLVHMDAFFLNNLVLPPFLFLVTLSLFYIMITLPLLAGCSLIAYSVRIHRV